jgi:hypothetical protein
MFDNTLLRKVEYDLEVGQPRRGTADETTYPYHWYESALPSP